jgi:uncharacterized delta-60 repeat protein
MTMFARRVTQILAGRLRPALTVVLLLGLLLAVLPAPSARAQSPDDGFDLEMEDPYGFPGGYVESLAVQADGKIVAGGDFWDLGRNPKGWIWRFNPDGSLDTSFDPAPSSNVYALVVQPDGKILVEGYFTTLGGQPRDHIGRLNLDGGLDTSFDPGAEGDFVFAVEIQSDGKILVGGNFTTLGGQMRDNIGRLNLGGSLDTAFDPGAGIAVRTLAVQTDGKIVMPDCCALSRQYQLVRINPDGNLDTSFEVESTGAVGALALQADGKVLASGSFTGLGGQPRSYIARLSSETAAAQDLAVDVGRTTVTWMRSGAGPEVWRVTFESSTDGLNYAVLGDGTRISGGWQLAGLALPTRPNLFVRARGYYASGASNGSTSVVESVRYAYGTRNVIYLPVHPFLQRFLIRIWCIRVGLIPRYPTPPSRPRKRLLYKKRSPWFSSTSN